MTKSNQEYEVRHERLKGVSMFIGINNEYININSIKSIMSRNNGTQTIIYYIESNSNTYEVPYEEVLLLLERVQSGTILPRYKTPTKEDNNER